MKKFTFLLFLLPALLPARGQKIDSIYFNLYTDSLKKGTFNYINVDAKYDNGRYLPLDTKSLDLTSTDGRFEGNSLWLPADFKPEKVIITAKLKANPAITRQITIYIKTRPDNEKLKTPQEILREMEEKGRKGRKKVNGK